MPRSPDRAAPAPAPAGALGVTDLATGWTVGSTPPGQAATPADAAPHRWLPARVPGTVAAALRDAGDPWSPGSRDLDDDDWWFRLRFEMAPASRGEELILHLGGIATVADVFLGGEPILETRSMFAAHRVDVSRRLDGENELAICCRALTPLLAERRKPRARWRTRLVKDGNLRFFRTMLIGRAPGFAPGPAPVGPWRGVWLERRARAAIDDVALQPRIEGEDGVLDIDLAVRALDGAAIDGVGVELSGRSGSHRSELALENGRATGQIRIPGVERWWPHTHGTPALHDVRVTAMSAGAEVARHDARVGFRSLAAGASSQHDVARDGLDLHVNGSRVFARGAVWTPVDPVGLAPSAAALRAALEQARDAGMNMLRVPGIGVYESDAFHDLCDELGILVWQDLMFANMDYPFADPEFRELALGEAEQVVARLAGRPSTALVCGSSEVEQQAAMLGLDPAVARGEFFGETLPELVEAAGETIYVPSAPCGGDLPFRPGQGIANYYGVGAYLRPLADARLAGVRFAAECLAFANVPSEETVELLAGDAAVPTIHDPRWKQGVPRDAGAGWDFEDVRDHYLELLFGVDPVALRSTDTERYLELSAAVTGEVMAAVFGEWRRAGSPSGGGLVLWLRDLMPGPGWGLVDSLGLPKVAYHHLRRALAPVAVWMTDEGLDGLAVHAANDGPAPLDATLRVALYRDRRQKVDEVAEQLELGPRAATSRNVETMLGRFADVSWAYRFGPPAADLIVASLEDGEGVRSQAAFFPAGRLAPRDDAAALGLEASLEPRDEGEIALRVATTRFADTVRISAPGYAASDDAFCVEPDGKRVVKLRPRSPSTSWAGGTLAALNLAGRVKLQMPEETP